MFHHFLLLLGGGGWGGGGCGVCSSLFFEKYHKVTIITEKQNKALLFYRDLFVEDLCRGGNLSVQWECWPLMAGTVPCGVISDFYKLQVFTLCICFNCNRKQPMVTGL